MKKARFSRYASKSSFLVSRRDIPSTGGTMVAASGIEVNAEVRDSVRKFSDSTDAIKILLFVGG